MRKCLPVVMAMFAAPAVMAQVAQPAQGRHVMLRGDEGVHAAKLHRSRPEQDGGDAARVLQELRRSQEMLTDLATGRHGEIVAWS